MAGRRGLRRLGVVALVLAGCASAPEPVRLDDWMRVGVDPRQEAARVEQGLTDAGWQTRARVEGEGFVALGFQRAEQRAVRVITRRGVAASLDSHEPDGVRERHGPVRLVDGTLDVDRDDAPELTLARGDGDDACLAIVEIDDEGRVTLMPDDADALQPGSCVTALEDVDGDETPEALALLRWPELALESEVAEVRAVLTLEDGGWRARGTPTEFGEAERTGREERLTQARAARDLDAALRLAVELTALAHLDGATVPRQVERFDAALSGLVLTEPARDAAARAREVIASGWGAAEDPAMAPGSRDGQEEEARRGAPRLSEPEGDQDP